MKTVRVGIVGTAIIAGAMSLFAPTASAQVYRPKPIDPVAVSNLCDDLRLMYSDAIHRGDFYNANRIAADYYKSCGKSILN